MLNDAGDEIENEKAQSFLEKSLIILTELQIIVSSFGSEENGSLLESFGQQMGLIKNAASSLSLDTLVELTRLGKELSDKGRQVSEQSKVFAIQGLLSQLVRSLEDILKSLEKGRPPLFKTYTPLIQKLQKASEQLGDNRSPDKN